MKSRIAGIPQSYIVRIGKMVGSLLYILNAPHRRIVRRNLGFVHPEWSLPQIRRFSKRNFQHYGITCVEILQLAFSSREDVVDRSRVRGEVNLLRALKDNRGVILISAHLGNHEVGVQYLSCHLHQSIVGVAKKMRHKPLNRWLHDLRTRFGNRIIYKKGALPEMTKTLRKGGLLALLIDQSRQFLGVDVDFLGHRATATPAVALLALRCKSPVLPVFCYRESDGILTLDVGAPLDIRRTKNLRYDLQRNTQIMTDAIEDAVRKYPEQWFWYLKRWKKHYPELYPGYKARLQRIKKLKNRALSTVK
jgi:KDO2-lipid IV(A) lauroyltransferase